jgi:flagellar hook-basal body complex protein FliE
MLRVSAQTTETEIDIQGIGGNADSADQGIEFGSQLMRFAESVANRDQESLNSSRQALLDAAGTQVLVDAAGVAANFQRMVRIADSIGIPYDDTTSSLGQEVRDDLNLMQFRSAQHTAALIQR